MPPVPRRGRKVSVWLPFTRVALITLMGSGCSLLLKSPTFSSGDAGAARDAATDAGSPADASRRDASLSCTADDSCLGADETCESGVCVSCDADGDSFYHPRAACDELRGSDPADCDDSMSTVYPGAAPICGDGLINGCEPAPAEIASALDVQEIGVLPLVPIFRTEAGGQVQSLMLGAVSSSGGEANAAAAVLLFSGGPRQPAILPFDHRAIAATSVLVPMPTARAWESVVSVDLWTTDGSAMTVAVNASVREGTAVDVPFFGRLAAGFTEVPVSPVEPDRSTCDYRRTIRHAHSDGRDALVYIGSTGTDTYSLHATSPSGTVSCIPDLAAAGFAVDDFVGVVAAGDFAILTSLASGLDIRSWRLNGTGSLRGVTAPPFLEAPFFRLGMSDLYSVVFEDMSDVLHQYLYECLPMTGCSEIFHVMQPANGFVARAAASWGGLSAVAGPYDGRMVEGEETSGVELILQSGEDMLRLPILSQATGPGGLAFWTEAIAAVPPVVGAVSTDLLVGLALRHPDTSSSIDVAVVRGCFAR